MSNSSALTTFLGLLCVVAFLLFCGGEYSNAFVVGLAVVLIAGAMSGPRHPPRGARHHSSSCRSSCCRR